MKKLEARFATRFRLWAKRELGTCALELKHTRGKAFFDCRELKEHQYFYLLAAADRAGLAYKIPDDSMGAKPFDMVVLRSVPAFVVIRYEQGAVGIHIRDWDRRWTRLHFDKAMSVSSFFTKI